MKIPKTVTKTVIGFQVFSMMHLGMPLDSFASDPSDTLQSNMETSLTPEGVSPETFNEQQSTTQSVIDQMAALASLIINNPIVSTTTDGTEADSLDQARSKDILPTKPFEYINIESTDTVDTGTVAVPEVAVADPTDTSTVKDPEVIAVADDVDTGTVADPEVAVADDVDTGTAKDDGVPMVYDTPESAKDDGTPMVIDTPASAEDDYVWTDPYLDYETGTEPVMYEPVHQLPSDVDERQQYIQEQLNTLEGQELEDFKVWCGVAGMDHAQVLYAGDVEPTRWDIVDFITGDGLLTFGDPFTREGLPDYYRSSHFREGQPLRAMFNESIDMHTLDVPPYRYTYFQYYALIDKSKPDFLTIYQVGRLADGQRHVTHRIVFSVDSVKAGFAIGTYFSPDQNAERQDDEGNSFTIAITNPDFLNQFSDTWFEYEKNGTRIPGFGSKNGDYAQNASSSAATDSSSADTAGSDGLMGSSISDSSTSNQSSAGSDQDVVLGNDPVADDNANNPLLPDEEPFIGNDPWVDNFSNNQEVLPDEEVFIGNDPYNTVDEQNLTTLPDNPYGMDPDYYRWLMENGGLNQNNGNDSEIGTEPVMSSLKWVLPDGQKEREDYIARMISTLSGEELTEFLNFIQPQCGVIGGQWGKVLFKDLDHVVDWNYTTFIGGSSVMGFTDYTAGANVPTTAAGTIPLATMYRSSHMREGQPLWPIFSEYFDLNAFVTPGRSANYYQWFVAVDKENPNAVIDIFQVGVNGYIVNRITFTADSLKEGYAIVTAYGADSIIERQSNEGDAYRVYALKDGLFDVIDKTWFEYEKPGTRITTGSGNETEDPVDFLGNSGQNSQGVQDLLGGNNGNGHTIMDDGDHAKGGDQGFWDFFNAGRGNSENARNNNASNFGASTAPEFDLGSIILRLNGNGEIYETWGFEGTSNTAGSNQNPSHGQSSAAGNKDESSSGSADVAVLLDGSLENGIESTSTDNDSDPTEDTKQDADPILGNDPLAEINGKEILPEGPDEERFLGNDPPPDTNSLFDIQIDNNLSSNGVDTIDNSAEDAKPIIGYDPAPDTKPFIYVPSGGNSDSSSNPNVNTSTSNSSNDADAPVVTGDSNQNANGDFIYGNDPWVDMDAINNSTEDAEVVDDVTNTDVSLHDITTVADPDNNPVTIDPNASPLDYFKPKDGGSSDIKVDLSLIYKGLPGDPYFSNQEWLDRFQGYATLQVQDALAAKARGEEDVYQDILDNLFQHFLTDGTPFDVNPDPYNKIKIIQRADGTFEVAFIVTRTNFTELVEQNFYDDMVRDIADRQDQALEGSGMGGTTATGYEDPGNDFLNTEESSAKVDEDVSSNNGDLDVTADEVMGSSIDSIDTIVDAQVDPIIDNSSDVSVVEVQGVEDADPTTSETSESTTDAEPVDILAGGDNHHDDPRDNNGSNSEYMFTSDAFGPFQYDQYSGSGVEMFLNEIANQSGVPLSSIQYHLVENSDGTVSLVFEGMPAAAQQVIERDFMGYLDTSSTGGTGSTTSASLAANSVVGNSSSNSSYEETSEETNDNNDYYGTDWEMSDSGASDSSDRADSDSDVDADITDASDNDITSDSSEQTDSSDADVDSDSDVDADVDYYSDGLADNDMAEEPADEDGGVDSNNYYQQSVEPIASTNVALLPASNLTETAVSDPITSESITGDGADPQYGSPNVVAVPDKDFGNAFLQKFYSRFSNGRSYTLNNDPFELKWNDLDDVELTYQGLTFTRAGMFSKDPLWDELGDLGVIDMLGMIPEPANPLECGYFVGEDQNGNRWIFIVDKNGKPICNVLYDSMGKPYIGWINNQEGGLGG